MMKFGTKLIVTAMAGAMALSLAACGNASVDNMPKSATGRANEKNNTEFYDSNRVYPYRGPADNKGNVRRHMTDGMDDTRRAAGDIGRDIKHGVKDAVDDTGRAAGEIGRDIKRGAKDIVDDTRRAADDIGKDVKRGTNDAMDTAKKDMNRAKQDMKDNMMNE